MYDVIIRSYNESFIHVAGEPSVRYDLHERFKFHVEGSQFSPKVKYGVWDGFIRLYNIQNQLLPKGLMVDLLQYCKSEGYSIDFDKSLIPRKVDKETYDEWLDTLSIKSKGNDIKPHWYQYDSVHHAINKERALLKLPTSAGKSLIIALLTKWEIANNGRVLILVPTDVLRYQMNDDLIDYTLFTQDEIQVLDPKNKKQKSCRVVITTWQTAVKQSKEWLEDFTMLLNDEVHLATGKSLQTINEKMVNASYKIGLTGTLKDAKCHIMQLTGLFGDVFAPISTRQMIDEGAASQIGVQGFVLEFQDEERKAVKEMNYQGEIDFIINHDRRNKFIAKLGTHFKDENTIILFNRVEHGKILYRMVEEQLAGTGRKVYLIFGGTAKDHRQEAKKNLETEVGSVVIASYGVFATGVSINNLHNAIFAHPTKSKIISLQSLGRLLRKHKSKAKAKMFDLVDDLCWKKAQNYAYKHGIERLKFYAAEEHELSVKKVKV
jgi:superfamily II DNA or RNA helicase